MEDDPWRGSGTLLRNRVSAPYRFYGLVVFVWVSLGLGLWLKGEIEILTGGLEFSLWVRILARRCDFGLWVRKLHLAAKWRGLSNKFMKNCIPVSREKLLVRKQA